MFLKSGKFTSQIENKILEKYSDSHMDILWYLLHITKITRLSSKKSVKEFLTRYLLIVEKNINATVLEFIDHGILIDGTINNNHFSFSVKDLINLIGFSCTDLKFNIYGTTDWFIAEYKYVPLDMTINGKINNKPTEIAQDLLAYSLMEPKTLFEIDSLNLTFCRDVKNISNEKINHAISFSEYVVNQIDDKVFENHLEKYPMAKDYQELFYPENIIRFDVFKNLEKKVLAQIYTYILDEGTLKCFIEEELSGSDLVSDLSSYNEHIVFAYGVKHGHILLTNNQESYHSSFNTYYDINLNLIESDEGIFYPTQLIFDRWKMKQWIHLLP